MKNRSKLIVCALLSSLLLPSCGTISGNTLIGNNLISSPQATAILSQLSRQKVKVTFLNQLPSGKIVPLVPEPIESISFNRLFTQKSSEFPPDQGLQQVFPFIEEGQHLLEIKFKTTEEPVQIPLVVKTPEEIQLNINVIFRFDSDTQKIQDIQIGYDQNENHELDPEFDIYRSQNGKRYLVQQPNGSVNEWRSPFDQSNAQAKESDQPLLPPGTESSKNTQTGTQAPQPTVGQEPAPLPPIEIPPAPMPQPPPAP